MTGPLNRGPLKIPMEVGLYPSASPHGRIATPHLDQFGREGMVFRQAFENTIASGSKA